ncbi:MAG: ABC transporter substrate-binding protein, partial [Rhodovibrionaceae bacterium]|nr:ABC transporter substrate-binding protein [Rhodovibrionaceae bacterium]
MKKFLGAVAAVAVALPIAADAKTMTVGVASGVNSLDPHFHNESPTNSANYNIFDGLVNFDEKLNPYGVLAESWENIDPSTWEFTLKQGVKFHNGNTFNADDVVFSFNRIKTGEKSGFRGAVSAIKAIEKIDDYKIRVITDGPYPILLNKLSYVRIMDKELASTKSDEELGQQPVGTGPYKLDKWVRGQSLTLVANEDYHRGAPSIDRVEIRPLTNDSARVASMLSGAVDLINRVPVRDVERIKQKDDLQFHIEPGLRLIYLQMDQHREDSPFISGVDKNPFLDVRVRKAVYHGIDETAIVKHIMGGFAKAAGQYHPEAVTGHDPGIERPPYNPEKAKKLLEEAGYGDGFTVTLDSPNDRYINDEKIAQAVASSLAKIGITVEVNAIPKASFFPKANNADSSFNLIGWASGDGDASSFLD